MSNLESFVAAARVFSEWCESPPNDGTEDAKDLLRCLVQLYSAALELRTPGGIDYEVDASGIDDAAWKKVYERTTALPFDTYSLVYNPHEVPSEEPVVASIADDIADVYRDLSRGLEHYDAERRGEAEWEFVFSFQSH